MVTLVRFSAGSLTADRNMISLDLKKSGFNDLRSDVLSRLVEFWCMENCEGAWRIEETTHRLTVWFNMSQDVVTFMISREYLYFKSNYCEKQFMLAD
jgi:hypothetical protein